MSRFAFPDAPGDLIGAHLSTRGGLHTIFERASAIDASCAALFAKNGNQWKGKTLTDDDCATFHAQRNVQPLLTHASYLINLASTDAVVLRKSIAAMIDELDRAERLGIHAVVLHPGAHLGAGAHAGIDQIARSLDEIHAAIPHHRVVTLLETAAGQGTCLGCTFEELGQMRARVDDNRRVGICFDTCHVFAAGYELRTRDGYERAIDEMDRFVGLDHVGAFHLNDSKKPLGARVDRHEHIGDGHLGLEPFRFLLNDPRFTRIPKLIETPKPIETVSDQQNLARLRALIGEAPKKRRVRAPRRVVRVAREARFQ
ncbi:MAG: deoxyribonuclease IV [Acidobacteria bacterium]|nr:deoxyribonuclease IV [Acidobacteriota bacterium]MBV9477181.1 deoxyribonuclease IV [Acidobacteriota bacterium]